MFVNWSLEAVKWQLLISKLEQISFKKALRAVFSGVTFGIFTPARVGEVGGRILVLKQENRLRAVIVSSLGSYTQFFVTLSFGLLSLSLLLNNYPEKALKLDLPYINTVELFIKVFLFCTFPAYFFFPQIAVFLLSFPKFEKYRYYFEAVLCFNSFDLFKILILSAIRYLVFHLQFFLVLYFFSITINAHQIFICVALMYFVMLLIPVVTLSEIGIRGSVSLFFFGLFSQNPVGIVAASLLIWLINIAIPAIIGSLFVLKVQK